MSERGNMPVESWRPQRRASLLDGQGLRIVSIAGCVLVALGGGYAGYAMVNRAPRIIPVIEADSRPIRVRPDNPGGMQVAGAEEAIMGGEGNGRADAMAPPPEVPQPQVLRAQIEAARQPAPAPPPAQPVSLAAPPAPPPPAISAAPEQRPAAAPPPPRATPARPVAAGLAVQLAALDSEAAAMAEWQRLAKKMPELLSSHQPAVLRLDRDGKTFFRLRTGGFSDAAQAASFCTQVKAKGGGCSVASF